MEKSIDAEVKERLEKWRKWVFSAHFPGVLSSQNIVQGILYNTAFRAANQPQRIEQTNEECEETERWIIQLLNNPDTYFGALAVQMKYTSYPQATEHLAKYFPQTHEWPRYKKAGGNFEDFRERVLTTQKFKRNHPDEYKKARDNNAKHIIKLGVTDFSFIRIELEGRNYLVGIMSNLASYNNPSHLTSMPKIYHLLTASQ